MLRAMGAAAMVAVLASGQGLRGAADERPGSRPHHKASAMVQLFEWSWPDVAAECEQFLSKKGFTAALVSPPADHIQGDPWWTRYQPVTYNLTSRSGNESQFKDMVSRCSAVGVGVYVDAVFNHIAAGSGVSVAGNKYGSRSTPIYSPEDMHHKPNDDTSNCGINDWNDKHQIQYCDLEGLPDLCTGCDSVRNTVGAYLTKLKSLGVAGLRIDAAKHQDVGELGKVLAVLGGELFIYSEVPSGGQGVLPAWYTSISSVTEFNYMNQMMSVLQHAGQMGKLWNWGSDWGFLDGERATVFMDNHDTQRSGAWLNWKATSVYKLGGVFMLAHPYGYPKLMSSFDFDDSTKDKGPPSTPVHKDGQVNCGKPGGWVCEHRWSPIANMVAFRRSAGNDEVSNFQTHDPNNIAFCRGDKACVALNRHDTNTWGATVHFSVPPGVYCNVVESDDVSTCPRITVQQDGTAQFQVPAINAVAVHIGKKVGDLGETQITV